MAVSSILIVEDDPLFLKLATSWLSDEEMHIHTARNSVEALLALEMDKPDKVLLDVYLGDESGLDILCKIVERYPKLPVMMMTSSDETALVVRAMQIGATDYLMKPLDFKRVKQTIKELIAPKEAGSQFIEIEKSSADEGKRMVGATPQVLDVFKAVGKISSSRVTVLIEGESGTGKEVLARQIHSSSDGSRPFAAVNCSAIPDNLFESELFGHAKGSFTGAATDHKGMFEQAGDGTLFLDEIGTLSLPMQAKLLRVIQEREFTPVGATKTIPVRARVIAASNIALDVLVKAELFREDLYYRLNVIPLKLPPLRDRREDIPRLVSHFIRKVNATHGTNIWHLSETTLLGLCAFDWPGNIRQLEHVLTRAMVLSCGDVLEIPELGMHTKPVDTSNPFPVEHFPQQRWDRPLEEVELEHILRVLNGVQGNRSRAALVLGIAKPTLYSKLKKLGISSRVI